MKYTFKYIQGNKSRDTTMRKTEKKVGQKKFFNDQV